MSGAKNSLVQLNATTARFLLANKILRSHAHANFMVEIYWLSVFQKTDNEIKVDKL